MFGQYSQMASALSPDQKKIFEEGINYYDIATCDTGGAVAPTGTITPGNEVPDNQLPGSTPRAKIWNYLIAQGWTPVQAAGIMGNIYAEGGWDPTNIEDPAGQTKDPSNLTDQTQGYGLVGFTPGASLLTNSPTDWSVGGKSPIKVTKDNVYYISTQLDVVYNYMKYFNNEMQTYINQATSPAAGAVSFMNTFENPSVKVSHESKREGAAVRAMRDFGNNAAPGDSTPTANNAASVDISDVMDKYNLQSAMIQQVNGGVIAAASAHQPPTTPASTMKLIIADTALRSGLDLSKTVNVTPDVYYNGTNDLGNQVTLEEALQAMLNQSDNVAANVLMKAMGGVSAFTQKAQGYGYNDTNVGGYYDASNDGKNTSTIADEVSAMNHIFSTSGDNYKIAQDASKQAAQSDNHYSVSDVIANKWGGTSDVAGNVGLFNINGKQYIIGLYYNGNYLSSQAMNAIKNGSADLADLVKNSPPTAPTSDTCSCPAGGSTGPVALTGSDNEEKTWNFLKAAGLSDAAVAGVMGSFQQESGFNPEILESGGTTKDPGSAGHTGYGLAQWYSDLIEGEAKDNNVSGPIYLLATQLSLVLAQMKGTSPTGIKNTFDAMKNMTDATQAATYFTPNFEGGTDPNGVRESNAVTILQQYGGKGGSGSVAPTGGSPSANCGNPSGLSPNCQAATGSAKILCAAKQYDTVSYVWGGGHAGGSAYHKACTTINTSSSCGLDCSGLVSIAVYDAFGVDLPQDTTAEAADSQHWQHVQLSQVQPGDLIQPDSGHVEIIDHVSGSAIYTFGAHDNNRPQPDQVSPTQYPKSSSYVFLHWVGSQS